MTAILSAPTPTSRLGARRRGNAATVTMVGTTAVLGIAVVLGARWGPDWPAQQYRAWLASHSGLTTWTNGWYSGQPLPGYSVLYPLFGLTLGASLTGLGAVIAASWVAAKLAPTVGWRAGLYVAGASGVLIEDLVIGQIPYLLGVAFAVWAFWSALQRKAARAVVLAVACSLSSPLAGAFLILVAVSLGLTLGWRRVWGLFGATIGIAISGAVGGGGGTYPFRIRGLVAIGVFVTLCFVLTDRHNRAIRTFAVCYALASVAAFTVSNPIGGNISRLAQLVALPLACHFLRAPRGRARRLVSVAAVVLAISWPLVPSSGAAFDGARDPARNGSYYTGLLRFLSEQGPLSGRVEVVPTRGHWESYWVARTVPIDRGWERQTDLAVNAVVYRPLTSDRYRRWLDQNATQFVALPAARLDYGGKAEEALLRRAPGYLIPVFHDRNWRVWRVRNPQPLVSGAAGLVAQGTASVVLTFARPGTAEVAVRDSAMWAVTSGHACLASSSDGWIDVRATQIGTVTLRARLTLGNAPASRCSKDPS